MASASVASPAERVDQLEQELAEIRKRMTRSERIARLWSGLALLGFAGLVVFTGLVRYHVIEVDPAGWFGPTKSIVRREYILNNQRDKKVVILDCDKFGSPNLAVLDNQQNYRAEVRVEDDGSPLVRLFDRSGPRAELKLEVGRRAYLRLTGTEQKGGVLLEAADDGMPGLTLSDREGKVLFRVPETKNDTRTASVSQVSLPHAPRPLRQPGLPPAPTADSLDHDSEDSSLE